MKSIADEFMAGVGRKANESIAIEHFFVGVADGIHREAGCGRRALGGVVLRAVSDRRLRSWFRLVGEERGCRRGARNLPVWD
jgi:hypothetical protein